jgi:hypothetical protein
MKLPHLLRVEEEADGFAALIAAARQEGLRIGWLDLATPVTAPPELAPAAAAGALRAVAAPAGCNIVVKPRRGAPVLLDLLREYFLGCVLVLVRGGAASLAAHPVSGAAGSGGVGSGEAGSGAPGSGGGAGSGEAGSGAAVPRLRPAVDGWVVEPVGAAARHFATGDLVSALRRPRPWDS